MPTKSENTRKRVKGNKSSNKHQAIMNAAEKVFAEKGFHEATISDIAKEAGVADPTIYEYFSSKEDLLFSVPAGRTLNHWKKNEELLQYIQGATNKLRLLIYRHIRLYELNPNYAKLVMLILKSSRNFLETEAYKNIQGSAKLIIHVLEEGVKTGEFRPDIQPYLVRAMIYGTIEHLVIRKSLTGVPEDIMSLAEDIIKYILQGIMVVNKDGGSHIHLHFNDQGKIQIGDGSQGD